MMKWWGWGDENVTFHAQEKAHLLPWINVQLGIVNERPSPPIDFDSIQLPEAKRNPAFISDLTRVIRPDQMMTSKHERVLHAFGKSYPDLFRVRRGEVSYAPDLVLLPENHSQVEAIVTAAVAADVCLIPFGGGTNIVGAVNPTERTGRMVVSLDMRRMNRLLHLDARAQTATIETGALGPKLEEDLQARGYSLGHCPDSFEFSTLGGWIATRSAGMQSDAYGKIEDMVRSLKMVTPQGTLTTRTVPKASTGIDVNHFAIGSEGALGVITEATMQVHRTPEIRDYRGFLFRSFDEAVEAIYTCVTLGALPSMIRLQDPYETAFALQMKTPKAGWAAVFHTAVKTYLRLSGYARPCLMIVGYEGNRHTVSAKQKMSLPVFKKYGAFSLGAKVGQTWSKDKFLVPYLRDFLMDRSIMVDVAETSAVWSRLLPLYHSTLAHMQARFAHEGEKGYLMCHLSHTYSTGACLYFTYATPQAEGRELEQYYGYKRAITDHFLKSGASLSHHHAVGIEHLPWIREEISETGLLAVRGLKASLDPQSTFNPGKLIPVEEDPWKITKAAPPHASGLSS